MALKKGVFAFAVLVLIVFSISVGMVNAEVILHENSSSIETNYVEDDFIRGKVNMSFTEEENNRFTSSFSGGIKLHDLLKNLSVGFVCNPKTCKDTYFANNGATTKDINVVNKIVGFKVSGGIVNNIESLRFNLSDSNTQSSCENQINVDLFNDGIIDFYNIKNSEDVCGIKKYGCFKQDEYGGDVSNVLKTQYCEKINLSAAPGYRIGANVKKLSSEGDKLKFSLYGSINNPITCESDNIPEQHLVGEFKEIGCNIDFGSIKPFEAFVCIRDEKTYVNGYGYGIKIEDDEPCGGNGDPKSRYSLTTDFEIFAQPLKYAPMGEVEFTPGIYNDLNKRDLKADIKNYLNQTYKLDCKDDCVIPVLFNGTSTNSKIHSARITYTTTTLPSISNEDIYDLSNRPFTISMNNTFLDVEKMRFSVPNVNGSHDFYLCFDEDQNCDDDNSLISKKINVLIGFSFGVGPRTVLVGQKTYFIAQTTQSNKNISSTIWNFKDGTPAVSSSDNKAEHTFNEEKEYMIEVTVITNTGEISTKKFKIVVGETKKSINLTISKYRKRLSDADNSIRAMPEWVKNEIKEYLKPDNDEFIKISGDYVKLGSNANVAQYSAILTRLLDLKIPYIIRISEKATNIPIIIGYDGVNLNYIKEISGENDEDSESESEDNDNNIKKSITDWNFKNYETTIGYETISGSYDEGTEDILKIFTIKLNRKEDAEDVDSYLIISYPPNSIKFEKDYGADDSKGNSAVFIKLDKESPETIEFMIKGKELPSFEELGMYISPQISDLEVGKTIVPDLFRKAVEFLWVRFLGGIIPLIIAVIVVYILLQQWYKKNYEKHLFKNSDDLYNLINFVYNSRKIGMNDKDARKKLEEKKWKGEQLTYVFNKIDGKRTGMFEIPIFKFAENRKVKQEIEKRQKESVDNIFIKMKN